MFIKILFICFTFICLQSFVCAENILDDIEYEKYGRIYKTESLAERLTRLEKDYFGMEQQGNIASRLDTLSRVSKNSTNSVYKEPEYDFYPAKKSRNIRNFFSDLFDGDSMTGFTPSLTSSSYNGSSYYNSQGNNLGDWGNRVFHSFIDNQYNNYPYNHSFHRNHFNFPKHNRHPYYRGIGYNQFQVPDDFRPQNRIIRSFYVPPNVETRSTITIMKD